MSVIVGTRRTSGQLYASTSGATMRNVATRAALGIIAAVMMLGALGAAGRSDVQRECMSAHTFGNTADDATRAACVQEFGPRGY